MTTYKSEITGHLDIRIVDETDEFEGKTERWQEIYIHGDPEGLLSLADMLIRIANLDQGKRNDLPAGAKEHVHLRPKFDLSENSNRVIVGRLDAKGTGEFYEAYVARD